ncbi:MAG: glutathione S-transferase family protein [Gammaproteobacteria bacterium]|nr:glutathione S-transferase family protein [Gammaproteobacteria bacterium]
MPYEIYWGSGNPYSWCVLLALEYKRLKYKSRLLEFSKREHLAPEILVMNPRGQLPILKDGDYVVYESIAILAYLDNKDPGVPLFGSTAEEAGRIWQSVFEIENYLRDKILGIVHPIFFDDIDDNIDSIEKSACYVRAELRILDSLLGKSEYLTSSKISAADIILYPLLRTLKRALEFDSAEKLDLVLSDISKEYPNLIKWMMLIESVPGYKNTFPPNWMN